MSDQSATSSTDGGGSAGMDEETLDKQPFDVNDPAGTDDKKDNRAEQGDGMSPSEIDDQPFDVNGPAGTDEKKSG